MLFKKFCKTNEYGSESYFHSDQYKNHRNSNIKQFLRPFHNKNMPKDNKSSENRFSTNISSTLLLPARMICWKRWYIAFQIFLCCPPSFSRVSFFSLLDEKQLTCAHKIIIRAQLTETIFINLKQLVNISVVWSIEILNMHIKIF